MNVYKTFSINGCTALGPLDENPAIIGAGFTPIYVLAAVKYATLSLQQEENLVYEYNNQFIN